MIRYLMIQLREIIPPEELEPKVFWRTYGVIAWVSFLFAGVATMLFFATFDPQDLAAIATYPMEWSDMAIYTLGFFLFWIFGFCCSTLTCILLSLPLRKRSKSMPE